MSKQTELVLLPEEVANEEFCKSAAAKRTGYHVSDISFLRINKRSIDARQSQVKIILQVTVYLHGEEIAEDNVERQYKDVSNSKHVVIAGCGPAGMFAALRFIELGIKPIIIERGKKVKERRRDLAAINKQRIINPNSNYCFGEGGAGTYSDGKLYTRSTKRGDVSRILHTFVSLGADADILIDAHPHIGTNKLPAIIENLRELIISFGGEILFNTKLTDIIIEGNKIKSIAVTNVDDASEYKIETDALVLATGHSARDIFEMLYNKNILIEAKPFALGVRIEHPQSIIDAGQYHCDKRSEYLPPASYQFTHNADGRGVYSFCMCPGGIIAPAATDAGEIVVNGWSPSKRNNPYANSGIVVSVEEKDFDPKQSKNPLSALDFQRTIERVAFDMSGKDLTAPAQRMTDFINDKHSSTLPDCSYIPGIASVDLKEVLPSFITSALKEALQTFGKKMKDYLTNDAVLVGVESRTSSPVRIPRDKHTFMHPQIEGLYPCAEGAGYAGGIISAAIDGELCAEKCTAFVTA